MTCNLSSNSVRSSVAFRTPTRRNAIASINASRPHAYSLRSNLHLHSCWCNCRRVGDDGSSRTAASTAANQLCLSGTQRSLLPRCRPWQLPAEQGRPLATRALGIQFGVHTGEPRCAAAWECECCKPATRGARRALLHSACPAAVLRARRRRRPLSPAAAAAAGWPAAGSPADPEGDDEDEGEGEDEDKDENAFLSKDHDDLDDLLYTPGEEVPYFMGPLELREVPDAGVGVFMTEDVPCGAPLLASYPLALMRGPPAGHCDPEYGPEGTAVAGRGGGNGGGIPSPLELAHALEGARMSPLAAAWMTALYDGSDVIVDGGDGGDDEDDDGGGGSERAVRRLNQLRRLFREPFGASAAAPADDDGGGGGGDGTATAVTGVRCPLPPDSIARLVTFNAYGEARPDPVVAAVRLLSDERLCGCVGLWPPFSLINHSCAPSASYGLVGDVMVVRAATDLRAGQQVTISYFGRRALAPLEPRRAYLAQHYGFICGCERCSLEEEQEAEEGQEAEAEAATAAASSPSSQAAQQQGSGQRQGQGRQVQVRRLPSELPSYLEGLYSTCSRAAAPHLADILTGRRWGLAGGPVAAAASPGAATATVRPDEPLSELVEELTELYGYLSECWQRLLRAAAAAGAAGGSSGSGSESVPSSPAAAATADAGEGTVAAAERVPRATRGVGEGERAGGAAAPDGGGADGGCDGGNEGGGGGGGLSQQELLWLEGGVFVLLDQLIALLGTLGLAARVQQQYTEQAEAEAEAARRGGGEGGRAAAAKRAAAAAAAATSLRRKRASAAAAGRGKPGRGAAKEAEVLVESGGDGDGAAAAAAATAVEPLTAAAAMRALASRRWRVEELPPNFLLPYVDLLAQAQEVATAVAPGSDLAVACSVRLLYGLQAVLGPDADEFREAEISCYDALSARYGVVEYDTYEQILEVCAQVYGAAEVRLPGLTSGGGWTVAAAAQPLVQSQSSAGPVLPGGPYVDSGSAAEGGMVGLRLPAVPVEVEVVE